MKDDLTEDVEVYITDRPHYWTIGLPTLLEGIKLILRCLLDIRDKLDVIDSRSKTCP